MCKYQVTNRHTSFDARSDIIVNFNVDIILPLINVIDNETNQLVSN